MATHEAVGAAGRTLQALLRDRLEHPNGSGAPVSVTLGAPGPDRDPEGAAEAPRVNLFLFQVSENGHLANQEIPGSGHPGTYGSPPLSLVLHYLLTAFGSTANGEFFDETPAHLLLGSAMRVFHDHAVITGSLGTRRGATSEPVLDPVLRGEREHIKLTLHPLGLEDLSNLWTALALPYRLSVGYGVSVVQIESGAPRLFPRPVGELPDAGPRVHMATVRRPRLVSVAVRRAGDPDDVERPVPFARVGDTLVLRGSGLAGEGLAVRLGSLDLPPDEASPAGDRVAVGVPDDALPDGSAIPPGERLQPGAQPVAVVAAVPSLPGTALGSGQAAFVLVPGLGAVSVDGRTLTVTGTRLVAEGLPGQVIVGDHAVERRDYLVGSHDEQLQVTMPDTLPAWPATALVSDDLPSMPDLPGGFDVSVTIGGEGPVTATLPGTPDDLPEAAALLEAAIRGAAGGSAFSGARVAATDRRLVVVPGGLVADVVFDQGGLADALGLSPAAGGQAGAVYLSGALRAYPVLRATAPEVEMTIGGTTARVGLAAAPATPAHAAAALEEAVRAEADAAFAATRVTLLGDQLCIVPPPGADVAVGPTAGSDEHTARALQLAADYPVRVRVGRAESIDDRAVELPA